MNAELAALERNKTWSLATLPPGHKLITSKWVFKTKYNPNGTMERLKAILIALATAKEWPLHQLDINNAFLHGYIDEEIYMSRPEVYHKGNSPSTILSLKASFDKKFTIKDLDLAKYFLCIELCKTKHGIHLNQRKYILDLLSDNGLTRSKLATFPLLTQLKLSLNKGTSLSDEGSYRRLVVGRLLYLTMTRPNISYAVQHLSQFVYAPNDVHMQATTHLLKYLKGTILKGLFYPIQPHKQMTGLSDAD
ncbi:retrovirus-related pol polyprotein from transposon TNT 1-94 [Tanacetum coccineum]